MKKRYIFLAIAGLILGYAAKVEKWFEDEREIYFPITAEQIRAGVRQAQSSSNSRRTHYSYSVDNLKNKFQKKYGKNYKREINQRLALLKLTDFKQDSLQYVQAKQFYLELARNQNEDLLVRRQAYKNWLSMNQLTNEKKVETVRLGHLADFSDDKMLNSLTLQEN